MLVIGYNHAMNEHVKFGNGGIEYITPLLLKELIDPDPKWSPEFLKVIKKEAKGVKKMSINRIR